MRPDMQHLLVERGHAGTGYTRHQPKGWSARCRFRTEDDDQRESFINPWRRPQFSENLAPLRRYLAAQVGRPWAKVYSEIRSHVDADSAVQYHILQHLLARNERNQLILFALQEAQVFLLVAGRQTALAGNKPELIQV